MISLLLLIVFVHLVLVKLAMKYIILYFVRFYEEWQNFIGNFPLYPNYPDIYQVQKLLNPENSYDLNKVTHFFLSLWKYSNIEITGIFLSNDNLIAWLLYLYIVKRPCVCIDI